MLRGIQINDGTVINLPFQATQNGNHQHRDNKRNQQKERQQRQHPDRCRNGQQTSDHHPDQLRTGTTPTGQALDHNQSFAAFRACSPSIR